MGGILVVRWSLEGHCQAILHQSSIHKALTQHSQVPTQTFSVGSEKNKTFQSFSYFFLFGGNWLVQETKICSTSQEQFLAAQLLYLFGLCTNSRQDVTHWLSYYEYNLFQLPTVNYSHTPYSLIMHSFNAQLTETKNTLEGFIIYSPKICSTGLTYSLHLSFPIDFKYLTNNFFLMN